MSARPNPMHDWKRERFPACASSFEGAEAIYVEKPAVVHVRVSRVSCDDWGVKVTLVDSLMPGMLRLGRTPCEISAAWKIFSFSADRWQANYIPWRLLLDAGLIRAFIELAAQANQSGSTIDWNEGMKLISEYQRMDRPASPGIH